MYLYDLPLFYVDLQEFLTNTAKRRLIKHDRRYFGKTIVREKIELRGGEKPAQ